MSVNSISITKDTLLEARSEATAQTALITLMSQYGKEKKAIWIVVEGKTDPCYYINTITPIIPCDWEVIPVEAGNKKNLISVFKSLEKRDYDCKKILFFVDRDLSDFTNDIDVKSSNLYVTDGYSIENSLISEYVMFRILNELLGLHNLTKNEVSSIKDLFKEAKNSFINNMIIPMVIILYLRDHSIKVDGLQNINIKKMFDFVKGECSLKIKQQDLYKYIISNLNYNDSISKTGLETYKKKFLSHQNYKNLIRGKYMLAFLILFVISIRNDWKSFSFATTPAGKRSISLGTENAFENVAVRARTVPSLQEFYKASIIGTWLA